MKLLYITNLFPISDVLTGGIFITKRLETLREMNISFISFATDLNESGALSFVKRILRKTKWRLFTSGDTLYHSLGIRRTLIDLLLEKSMRILSKRNYQELINNKAKITANIISNEISKQKFSADLIHAHGMYYIGAGIIAMHLSKILKIPYVVTLHGSDINFEMRIIPELFLKVFKNASRVIFVSHALKQKAISYGYNGKNAIVIPNGYDPAIFYPMNRKEIRRKLGIYENGYKYVGFVGNLTYVKRADKFPEIFDLISKKAGKVKFIVVGDGKLRRFIEKKTRKLDTIFTGRLPQKEVAKWMNAMDVMILPSRNEGFGTVILEAQACGTAVVGSSNGGIPEAIGFDEFIVKDGKNFEGRFAEKVVEILKNGYNRDELIDRSRNFTWKNIMKTEIQIYGSILKL